MKKTERIQAAYEFFCLSEKQDKEFSLEEVVSHTHWMISTVRGYRTKKWYPFLVDQGNGLYKCKGITDLPLDAFIKINGQRSDLYPALYRPHFGEVVDAFIDKCQESAMLAIQIYNNPLVSFRTEGFIVDMIVAFTALFHAIFERDKVDYWHKDSDTGLPKLIDGEKKLWELSECIKQYYKDRQTPEKENLNICISFRNKIEHRFYKMMDLDLSGYCQALLFNFEELLTKEFGSYFSLGRDRMALALQISTYEQYQKRTLNSIQGKYYEEIKQYIQDFCQKLPNDIIESEKFCFRAFLVPKIGNHESGSDISLEWVKYNPDNPEELEQHRKIIGLIREKTVQVANQGKFLPGDVVKQILGKGLKFNISMHTKAWKLYDVRPREKKPMGCDTKYCQFSEPHKNFIYTKEWIDFLTEKLNDESEYQKIKQYKVTK